MIDISQKQLLLAKGHGSKWQIQIIFTLQARLSLLFLYFKVKSKTE